MNAVTFHLAADDFVTFPLDSCSAPDLRSANSSHYDEQAKTNGSILDGPK